MQKESATLNEEKIERQSYIWNTISGMLNAFQSVIILMVLTRVLGLEEAGIFTIAYATANLTLTVGKYGMRNYQVTDIKEAFTFSDYKCSRVITFIAMLIASVAYVIYAILCSNYSTVKAMVVLVMCVLKAIDAYEDIYHGMYQQRGRLDIAAKLLAYRMAITIAVLCIALVITRNQLISLCISTVITLLFFVVSIKMTIGNFEVKKAPVDRNRVLKLLAANFSLFLSSFLVLYIGNAPKYAIDSILNGEIQACYGFISMPIFVIGLLNQFIYQPILTRMASEWNEGDMKVFIREIFRQCAYIVALTLVVIVGGYLLGIPVLSILYSTDLTAYKTELLVLLLGGGLLALAGYLTTVLTIMRHQNTLLIGYVLVAIFAFILSPVFVRNYAVMGASVLYLVLMLLLSISFVAILMYELRKEKIRNKKAIS